MTASNIITIPSVATQTTSTGGDGTSIAFSNTLSDGYHGVMEVHINGCDFTNKVVASAIFIRSVKRFSNTVSWVGTPLEVLSFINGSDDLLKQCVVSWGTGGVDTYIIYVQGVAGSNIDWVTSQYLTEFKSS